MKGFLAWHNMELKDKTPTKEIPCYLIFLKVFLENIEKLQFVDAPKLPVNLLLFKEDFPRANDSYRK